MKTLFALCFGAFSLSLAVADDSYPVMRREL